MSSARTKVEPMMGGPGRHQVSLATPAAAAAACKCSLLNHSLCFSLFSWSRSSKPSVKLRSPGSLCESCLVFEGMSGLDSREEEGGLGRDQQSPTELEQGGPGAATSTSCPARR